MYVKDADPVESVVAVNVRPVLGPSSTVNVTVTPTLFDSLVRDRRRMCHQLADPVGLGERGERDQVRLLGKPGLIRPVPKGRRAPRPSHDADNQAAEHPKAKSAFAENRRIRITSRSL